MLQYDTLNVFQTSFWEKLDQYQNEAFYNRTSNNGEGSYRMMTKRTKFMRIIKPENLKTYNEATFPLEVNISYLNPNTKDRVDFILIYKNAKDCMMEVNTSNSSKEYIKKAFDQGTFSSIRKVANTQAQQAYATMEKAVKKLEAAGFVVVREEIEEGD